MRNIHLVFSILYDHKATIFTMDKYLTPSVPIIFSIEKESEQKIHLASDLQKGLATTLLDMKAYEKQLFKKVEFNDDGIILIKELHIPWEEVTTITEQKITAYLKEAGIEALFK
jgi:hypothetical protein